VINLIGTSDARRRTCLCNLNGIEQLQLESPKMSAILGQIGCGKVAATRKALQVLWTGINSKTVQAMTIWCRMKPVCLNLQELERCCIAFVFLDELEGINDWPACLARLNHFRHCARSLAQRSFNVNRKFQLI